MNKTQWNEIYKVYKLTKELGFYCHTDEYDDVVFCFGYHYPKHDKDGIYLYDIGSIAIYSPLHSGWKVYIEDNGFKEYELFSVDNVIEMIKTYDERLRKKALEKDIKIV